MNRGDSGRQCSLRRWIAGVGLILMFSASGGFTQEAENLAPNPGFEIDDDGDGLPDGWSFAWEFTHSGDPQREAEKQKPLFGWDDSAAHSGERSVFISNQRPQDDGVWTVDNVPALPGVRFYRLGAWIRTQNMKDTEALVCGVFLGEGGKWLGADYHAITVKADRDWTHYTGSLSPPAGTKAIRIRLWLNMRYSGTGTVWYDDVSLIPTERPVRSMQTHVDDRTMPDLTEAQREKGYVCYARNYLRLIFPTSIPAEDEIERSLSCFAAPGEREPVTFAIRALRDLWNVEVRAEPLESPGGATIGSEQIAIRPVRYGEKQGQSRWGPFHTDLMTVPLYLSSRERIDVAADTSHQYWITVYVPEDAKPDRYHGEVIVHPQNAPETRLPLEVEVLPIQLQEPDKVYFGMYHRPVGDDDFRAAAWRDMREHGMTSVGLCCNLGAKLARDGDRVIVTFDGTGDLERAVNEYLAAGFTMPIDWLMGRDVLRWCRQEAGEGDEEKFGNYYRQVIEAILDHAKEKNWPELIFQPVDEPFEHTRFMDDAERCLRVLKTIPGVRTEEDGPNGNPDLLERLYDLCDVLVYHDGPTLRRGTYDAAGWQKFLERTRKDGKEIWFYNIDLTGWHPEVLRFGYGFGLYQARGTGMIQWSYQTALKPDQPERVYTEPSTIIYCYPELGEETGGPTLAWEAAREGVDDYKYLHTLKRLVDKITSRDDKLGKRAHVLWSQIEEELHRIDFNGSTGSAAQGDWTGRKEILPDGSKVVSGDHKMANGFEFKDYAALRRMIADAIVELQKNCLPRTGRT